VRALDAFGWRWIPELMNLLQHPFYPINVFENVAEVKLQMGFLLVQVQGSTSMSLLRLLLYNIKAELLL
jgi:hypothetical protein